MLVCKTNQGCSCFILQGCLWHGCPCKVSAETIIRDEMTAAEVRRKDEEREAEIKKFHDIEIVWECAVMKELSKNSEMKRFFKETVVMVKNR